jgi:TorA maturation chaperone TorD
MAPTSSRALAFDPSLNMARQALYRFAALSLVDPRAGSWEPLNLLREERLIVDAADLVREFSPAAFTLGVGERPPKGLDLAAVLARLPESQYALNVEYENMFGLVVGSGCPPYETEYIGSKFTFQRSNALADISGFYHAFGFAIADERPERPDHIALELEFMALLLALERRAADGEANCREVHRSICREAQRRFLKDHLAWWVPAFARLLAHESRGGFYEAVGSFLAAFVPAERAMLRVDAQPRAVAPSPLESPEACDGCQLAT